MKRPLKYHTCSLVMKIWSEVTTFTQVSLAVIVTRGRLLLLVSELALTQITSGNIRKSIFFLGSNQPHAIISYCFSLIFISYQRCLAKFIRSTFSDVERFITYVRRSLLLFTPSLRDRTSCNNCKVDWGVLVAGGVPVLDFLVYDGIDNSRLCGSLRNT